MMPGMNRAVVLMIAAFALALSACAAPAADEPETTVSVEESVPPAPAEMPDLIGSTLVEAAKTLDGINTPVEVVFPAVEVTVAVEATRVAGAWVDAHVERNTWPERIKLLENVSDGLQRIVSQDPQPGVSLSSVATVTLGAGEHPNTTGQSWIRGHWLAVKRGGASPCFECHQSDDCSNCHVVILGK